MALSTESRNFYLAWFMLLFSFFMPAILLNTVGAVILNLVNEMHVSMGPASWLEAFKDMSILISALILSSFLPSFGYKKSLMVGIALELIGCLIIAMHPSIITARIFFVFCGIGFGLIKPAVYASVGLFFEDPSKHAGFVSLMEGVFMGGCLLGMWIYSFFVALGTWTTAFWCFGIMCVVNLLVVFFVKLDESKIAHKIVSPTDELKKDMKGMGLLLKEGTVWVFIVMTFFYVFIEQGITTWLPTYNNHVLHISDELSLQVTSLFPAALCVGRLASASVMKKIKWVTLLFFSMIVAFVLLVIAIFMSKHVDAYNTAHRILVTNWLHLPLVAYLIPLVGILIAPIYPTLCSSIISAHKLRVHSAMAGLIMVFSALGGTTGSRIVGSLFEFFGGLTAIKAPLIPIIIIFILLIPYYKMVTKAIKKKQDEEPNEMNVTGGISGH